MCGRQHVDCARAHCPGDCNIQKGLDCPRSWEHCSRSPRIGLILDFVCELVATSKLLVKATAATVAFVYEQYDDGGGTYTCADAGNKIQAAAQAVTVECAPSWASAVACTCCVNVDAVSAAVGRVLATGATEAYAAACVGACCQRECMICSMMAEWCARDERFVFFVFLVSACMVVSAWRRPA